MLESPRAVQAATTVACAKVCLLPTSIYVSLLERWVASRSATMAKDDNKSEAEYPREKLNKDLQKIVDRQDDWMDDLYEGQ